MNTHIRRTQRDYSLAFKLSVVDQVEKGEMTYKQVLIGKRTQQTLIHHLDRGIQYCSSLYQELHIKRSVRCSMTDGYDCYQNALAERVNGILKNEYLFHKPKGLEEAKKIVADSVRIYNRHRPLSVIKI